VFFLTLHFVHIRADYPNHSPWSDWAKYTDEGWYGSAAVRYVQLGHWYLPAEFNPGAALPVWPLMETVPFLLFGATMQVARYFTLCLFLLVCAASWLLLYRWTSYDDGASHAEGPRSLAPELAVLFLAVSPFCFVYFRMAILEPAIIVWMLLSLLLASGVVSRSGQSVRWWIPLAIGALCPLMVFTKTTAISLVPAIAFLLWDRAGSTSKGRSVRGRVFGLWCLLALAGALLVIVPYYLTIAHLHLAADVHNYFAGAPDRVNRHNLGHFALATLEDFRWIGVCFAPLCTVAALLALPRLRRNPIIPTLLLWAAGYFAFICYHTNLQPRYYLVPAVALLLVAAYVLAIPFQRLGASPSKSTRPLAFCTAVVLLVAVVTEAHETLQFAFHPQYTFLSAANSIHNIIAADQAQPHLLLSSSGSDIMLMTGTPAISDGVSILSIVPLVQRYNPGWLAVWGGGWEDGKLRDLQTGYRLHEVARFNVMDDPTRQPLILYRIDRREQAAIPLSSASMQAGRKPHSQPDADRN
jgi:hypothetical protein